MAAIAARGTAGAWRAGIAACCGALLLALAPRLAAAQANPAPGIHLGVASCAGSNCHGAAEPVADSNVMQNEYVVWSKRDKHRDAYRVLLEPRAIKMAQALGLPDAANQKLCLDCHADNVPPAQRGRGFQLSDGVGCEACHGGASGWLGIHVSGATHAQNIAAGLYPTDQPAARAEKCLSCHFGDRTRFVDHRLMGAGHPRLPFELDTFTATQPAHFRVTDRYIARKGRVTDLQVWAAGEALTVVRRMDAVLDPRRSHEGLLPEFVLYDCASCHHPFGTVARPTATGLGPGTIKFDDANVVMLQLAAARVAPDSAKALGAHLAALHRGTVADWGTVEREAAAIRKIAQSLVPVLAKYPFTGADMRALAAAAIAVGTGPDNYQVSRGDQVAMTLAAIVTNMRSAGLVDDAKADALTEALLRLYRGFAGEAAYRPEPFVKALRDLQAALAK